MDSLGGRLRQERLRLGMSQTEFGRVGGVQKLAQINYEKGERIPDANALAAWVQIGVDVLYILTGLRSQPLTAEEIALLDNYRNCPPEGKAAVRATSAALTEQNLTDCEKELKSKKI